MFKKEGIGKQVDIFVGIVGKGEKWTLIAPDDGMGSARRSFSFRSLGGVLRIW
jgi:hypothetical protein